MGFERIDLPANESMGLLGTTYLIDVGHGFSLGPAVYGAISGQRGGLFTIGAELAWSTRLAGPLMLQAGYYAGGGGGAAAPVGGGLMLRPHADLLWDFGRFKAGLSLSQVRFPSGNIDSRQIGLVVSADTDFSFASGGSRSTTTASGMGFDRMVAVAGSYAPPRGSRLRSGAEMGRHLQIVGMRFERFINREPALTGPRAYWGVEANGGAGGGVAGYAEYLGILGVEWAGQDARWRAGLRGALGMSGGGDVDMGGGALGKASAYAGWQLTRDLSLLGEVGYAKALDGRFRAPFAAVNLAWDIDGPAYRAHESAPHPAVRTEWVAGIGAYRAARQNGTTQMLHNVVLKANRFLDDYWYVTAQVHSAYSGNAGGYTAGLFGGGIQSPSWAGWQASAELLVGAGGGGGVASGGGALLQPMAYLTYNLTPSLSTRLGVGRVKSAGGSLSSPVGELLLAFSFGV